MSGQNYNTPSAEAINKLFDYAVAKRPPNWSHGSSATYYKEHYANNLKEAIDKQLINREDIIYRYSVFCGPDEEIVSKATLYTRVNQSIRYLLDHMDEQKVYLAWKKVVRIERKKGVGILLSIIPEMRNPQADFSPDFVLPKEDMPIWKRKMEDWLEGDSKIPFVIEGLTLREDEVRETYIDLNRIKGIAAQVTSGSIKIVRTN